MKPSTMHFLLFSLLIGVLGAMPLAAQHDTEQDRRRESREQFLPFHKRLPHPDLPAYSDDMRQAGLSGLPDGLVESPAPPMSSHHDRKRESDVLQRLPERVRERLVRDWDLSEIGELAPTDSKHRRYTDEPAPVIDGSAIQMLSSDSVVVDWIADYTSGVLVPSDDYATALALDGSGNVYVTGYSRGSGTSSYDYATVKYNASGVRQWVARYNGPGNSWDGAAALAVNGSGNVYVTGYSLGSSTSFDYATVKYNASGVQKWVARYNGPGTSSDDATAIALDGSGNVYVTGYSWGSGTSNDYATVKYNASGVEQWFARYNGPGNDYDYAYAIALDGSGNVYVTGESVGSGTNYDYATVKYNASGVEQWVARYDGPGNFFDFAYAIALDGSGNVYVTGRSVGSGTSSDYATVKYNASGVQQWVARYNGPGNSSDYGTAIALDGSGNVYVTGLSVGSGTSSDYATVKYNSAGAEQWVARYNGPGNSSDVATALALDGSGNVYVTGESRGSGTSYDYATVKYNASGVEQWVARYNGPGNSDDGAAALAVDGSGNVYVTGTATFADGQRYTTIKYRQSITGIAEGAELPREFVLYQNYPNPFNPSTNFQFSISNLQFVSLKIFDVLGRDVATLVNEVKQPGRYSVAWDAGGMPSGIYLVQMETGNFKTARKLLLLR